VPGENVQVDQGLSATFSSVSEAEASALAATSYGWRANAKRLATEKDDTFCLTRDDGARSILKIANPSESESELDLQVRLLAHIEQRDALIPAPRVLESKNGERLVEIIDSHDQRRLMRLMTYQQGTPLDSSPTTYLQRIRVGELLARLRLATAGFQHSAETRVVAWDVKHLESLQSLMEHVTEARHRDLLSRGLARFLELRPRIAALRTQVLHNDFSKSNLLVDPADLDAITGVIDFGDAVKTAIAIDVSTALLNQLPRDASGSVEEDIFAHPRDVLKGYLHVADLNDEELALIPHLVMARVITRALITLWRARLQPHNKTYILRNTEQGWAQLTWFLDQPVDSVSQALMSRSSL
jgi:hydroxylysine kinase